MAIAIRPQVSELARRQMREAWQAASDAEAFPETLAALALPTRAELEPALAPAPTRVKPRDRWDPGTARRSAAARGGSARRSRPRAPRMLTAQELEEALACAVLAADPLAWLAAHASAYPLLSAEEEYALGLRLLGDDEREAKEARDRLTLCNLRLVMGMAVRFFRLTHVELVDLTQEGILGLMRAVSKFDARAGYRFSTYASWWIAQMMWRAAASQGTTLRLPAHVYERRRRAMRVRSSWLARTGAEPTLAEWATEAGIAEDELSLLWATTLTPLSLDTAARPRAGDDSPGRRTVGDLMPDPQADEDMERAERNLQSAEGAAWIVEVAREALRDQRSGAMRLDIFVAHARDGVTLEALGRRYGMTREAVRQHYARARTVIQAAMMEARAAQEAAEAV